MVNRDARRTYWVRWTAKHFRLSIDESEDVYQDVAVSFLTTYGTLDKPSKAWRVSLRNEVIDLLRRRGHALRTLNGLKAFQLKSAYADRPGETPCLGLLQAAARSADVHSAEGTSYEKELLNQLESWIRSPGNRPERISNRTVADADYQRARRLRLKLLKTISVMDLEDEDRERLQRIIEALARRAPGIAWPRDPEPIPPGCSWFGQKTYW